MSKSKPKAAKAKQAKQARKRRPNDGELADDALDKVAGGLIDVCVVDGGTNPLVAAPFPNVRASNSASAKKNSQPAHAVQELPKVQVSTGLTVEPVPQKVINLG